MKNYKNSLCVTNSNFILPISNILLSVVDNEYEVQICMLNIEKCILIFLLKSL